MERDNRISTQESSSEAQPGKIERSSSTGTATSGLSGLSDDQRIQLRRRLEDLARGVTGASGSVLVELNPTGSPSASHNDWF